MITVIVHCDRCGAEIMADRTALDVRCGPLRSRRETIDLCPGCVQTFSTWLAGVAGIVPSRQPLWRRLRGLAGDDSGGWWRANRGNDDV